MMGVAVRGGFGGAVAGGAETQDKAVHDHTADDEKPEFHLPNSFLNRLRQKVSRPHRAVNDRFG